MKKLILVLALVLIASPAFAAVSFTLTQVGTTNVYTLGYTGADTANLPRAFGLNVVVTGGAKISAVTPTMTGESTAALRGYGIFPGTILIDANGVVTSSGSPVAPVGDPGAGPALPAANVVLELGSLYVGDANKPSITGSGTLCTLTIDCSGATTNQTITVSEEDTYRGGVVLTNGASATVAAVPATYTGCAPLDCLNQAVVPAQEWTDWNFWGKPACWCFRRQCRGDTNGTKNIYWVSLADFNLFKSVYNKNDTIVASIPNGICADLNHVKNIYRVSLTDFNAFKLSYNKSDASALCCDANQDCTLTQPEKWNFWTN